VLMYETLQQSLELGAEIALAALPENINGPELRSKLDKIAADKVKMTLGL
jgi:hypothetical protein